MCDNEKDSYNRVYLISVTGMPEKQMKELEKEFKNLGIKLKIIDKPFTVEKLI